MAMSAMTTSHRGMFPLAGVQPIVCGAFPVRPDAKQRAEGVEWVKPPVKSECELVEVGLQVLRADRAVMRSGKPSLQIRENKVNDGEKFLSHLGLTACDDRKVLIAAHGQRV